MMKQLKKAVVVGVIGISRATTAFAPVGRRVVRVPVVGQVTAPSSFDFSSAAAWDEFYQTNINSTTNSSAAGSEENDDSLEDAAVEWHSSVPMEQLAALVPSDASEVVMVGCGTSHLPEWIQACRPKCHLVLQDSSPTCLNILRQRYQDSMSYVCGDATQLSHCLSLGVDIGDLIPVDVVYDKGLMDAIFCNEGWNKPICSLIQESSKVLKDGGVYILVSYRLPASTREFLTVCGWENGMDWVFDLPGSNDRVGISIATKVGTGALSP